MAALITQGLSLYAATPVAAAPGDLDPTFGVGGKVIEPHSTGLGSGHSVAIQSDGKIVVGGGYYDFSLVRYEASGMRDVGFGTEGTVGVGDTSAKVRAVGIQHDGKILVAGITTVSDAEEFFLARYNWDGSTDDSFGVAGRVSTAFGKPARASALAMQQDGKIVLVGSAGLPDIGGIALARYDSSGSLDRTFGDEGLVLTETGKCGGAESLAIQPDGKLVVAGAVACGFSLIRYTASGDLDASFGSGGYVTTQFGEDSTYDGGVATGVWLQPSGKILATGHVNRYDSASAGYRWAFALARYTADGSPDLTFGLGGKTTTDFARPVFAYSSATGPDGSVVVAGETWPVNDIALARYLENGATDLAFGDQGRVVTDFDGGADIAHDVAIQNDGKVVVAGLISFQHGVARYEGSAQGGRRPNGTAHYVALGDSFSSGTGAPSEVPPAYEPGTDTDLRAGAYRNKCLRSVQAYPREFQRRETVAYPIMTFRACNGAVIENVGEREQFSGEGSQYSWVLPGTDLITLTIGGNDVGFRQVIQDCIAAARLRRSNPIYPTCESYYSPGGEDRISARIAGVKEELRLLYQKLRRAGSTAQLIVLGYPRLFREDGSTCVGAGLIEESDILWINEKTVELNDAIRESLRNAQVGGRFVSVFFALANHELCTDEPWVNGLYYLGTERIPFHPNAKGHMRLATYLQSALR